MQVVSENHSDPVSAGGAVRRILVVDDSRLQLRILSSMLEKWGFEVIQADSGRQALDLCRQSPPDIVLSDWIMPGMTGLDLCQAFRARSVGNFGYFILLTSKSDKEDIARGLDAGADDFLTKPVNPAELRARINAGARIVSMERELSDQKRVVQDTLDELRVVHAAIDKDLQQARKIQQSLIPARSQVVGSSRISLMVHPCGHVGGDLVGVFAQDDDQLGLYSIDVSGHGITSAMVTARIAGYLSNTFHDQNLALEPGADGQYALRQPEATARLLNQRLAADRGVEQYFTMAYATIDSESGSVRMVQAGHPPPLLLRHDGSFAFLGNGGLPIGLVDEVSHDRVEFDLGPGDKLILYSDGFTEAEMRGGGMLGEDGLVDLVRAAAAVAQGVEMLEDMFWRLTSAMRDGGRLADDVSAAMIEFGCEAPRPP
ncbi:PP2C family protein-serine/threonine phosphatase [Thalassococcus arenae]|uniref:PP2C family protein-serine/threonine phosphatase n=1 Tax=Thalassococcus arenae TaxID=2851652 RepID=UPI0032AEA928